MTTESILRGTGSTPTSRQPRAAYRRPEGGWVIPSTNKDGRYHVDRTVFTDGINTMAYAKLLMLIANRLHKEGRLDELLGVDDETTDNDTDELDKAA